MKPRKINKLLYTLIASACLSPWTLGHAAQQDMIWGNLNDYAPVLKNFTLQQNTTVQKNVRLPVNLGLATNHVNTLELLNANVDPADKSHVRYDQYYKGLPVWGSQVIYHVSATGLTTITGSLVNGIAKDIPNIDGKISNEDAKRIALGKNLVSTPVSVEKIIYFDQESSEKAALAYHVSYLLKSENGPSIPSFIIDANTGKVLEQWNALTSAVVGQGPGGVSVNRLPYRPGKFQFGTALPDTLAFGKMEVTVANNVCTTSNSLFNVVNLNNRLEQQLPFQLPSSNADDRRYQIRPFAYTCAAPDYLNLNDGGYAPINDGFSPINDVTYFIQQTFNMLTNYYQVPTPVGNLLPVRVYTHLGRYDNAFACGPTCLRQSGVVGPQQLVFGNGARMFSPITDGDGVSHEFGHLVTEHFSDLLYSNVAGGVNEAFSDMTGMAMLYYQSNTLGYSWYWDNKDWTTGKSVSKNGKPLRYFDDPTKDGRSIGHVSQYRRGMDPHHSSGVFNKAFYLLSTTANWNVEKAYRVMVNANMRYWTKNPNFPMAGCAVVQSASELAYSIQDVKNALSAVGVTTTGCTVI